MRAFEFITEGRPPFSPTPEQQQEIADLYASGFSRADIAKEYKITPQTMGLFLHRSRKLGETQSLTKRGTNKPGSKGIHAIRRTGSPSGSVFEGEIMRLHEFIYEEVGRVLDLTKNYPHYSILKGKILDISPKGKYKIQIVNAEIIPGKKVSVKVGDTVVIGANFLKQALKESELEEGWKGAAKGLAAAGALALAGHTFLPDPNKPAPTPRPISKQLPKVDSEITQRVNALINNPIAKALRREAAIAGIEGAELAQLIAQCAHETQNFTSLKEFGGPTYFRKYDIQHDPQKAKMLGNTEPGDGARYRGRGYIQLTGRYNYRKAGEALGLPLEDQPELLERPDIAAKATLWYWQTRVQPKVSNFKDTREVTKPINSGLRGLSDREEKFNAIMQFYNQPASG